jgi:hypothetical protein
LRGLRSLVGEATRPCLLDFGTADVHDRTALRREAQTGDRLPIVSAVMRYLARGEVRSLCNPNFARALGVEHQRNARSVRRRHQSIWKCRSQDLLECESFRMNGGLGTMSRTISATRRNGHFNHATKAYSRAISCAIGGTCDRRQVKPRREKKSGNPKVREQHSAFPWW